MKRLLFIAPLATAGLFSLGYWPRHVAQAELRANAEASAPRVKVTPAILASPARTIALPGTLVANQQTVVYARATGYVAHWRVDIGDHVKAGDVLADLDTPDLDQQLAQARATLEQKGATLEQTNANLDYARITATRTDSLLAEALASKQQDDQAQAQVKISIANVDAARADRAAAAATVRQLAQLVSFKRVVAPFDGRITQRTVDVGSLVVAGGAAGALPLFRMEAIDPIRVFIQIPQTVAASVKENQTASVAMRQLPGHSFEGRVTRTAGTFDPTSRTLMTEVDVPNPTGELLAGMFAQVTIDLAASHRVVRVPSSAVIDDARGVHVATVDARGELHLVPVVRGLDNGAEIDLVDGLFGGERVVTNPGGDVTDGTRVDASQEGPS